VSDAPSAALSGLRVLVIEDEFLIALDLRSILDDLGCVALGPAATVPEALRLLVTDPPDATLLDLNLGGASSAPVAEALTRGGRPFVIVTAYAVRPGPMLDGVSVVAKPFWAEEIRAALLGLAWP
jgi:CheY-like chemotaxis protein